MEGTTDVAQSSASLEQRMLFLSLASALSLPLDQAVGVEVSDGAMTMTHPSLPAPLPIQYTHGDTPSLEATLPHWGDIPVDTRPALLALSAGLPEHLLPDLMRCPSTGAADTLCRVGVQVVHPDDLLAGEGIEGDYDEEEYSGEEEEEEEVPEEEREAMEAYKAAQGEKRAFCEVTLLIDTAMGDAFASSPALASCPFTPDHTCHAQGGDWQDTPVQTGVRILFCSGVHEFAA
ncbi:hypothetical protein KIPB_015032, partial [Kipferlia bialata]|eukprot:g15032.t1